MSKWGPLQFLPPRTSAPVHRPEMSGLRRRGSGISCLSTLIILYQLFPPANTVHSARNHPGCFKAPTHVSIHQISSPPHANFTSSYTSFCTPNLAWLHHILHFAHPILLGSSDNYPYLLYIRWVRASTVYHSPIHIYGHDNTPSARIPHENESLD